MHVYIMCNTVWNRYKNHFRATENDSPRNLQSTYQFYDFLFSFVNPLICSKKNFSTLTYLTFLARAALTSFSISLNSVQWEKPSWQQSSFKSVSTSGAWPDIRGCIFNLHTRINAHTLSHIIMRISRLIRINVVSYRANLWVCIDALRQWSLHRLVFISFFTVRAASTSHVP